MHTVNSASGAGKVESLLQNHQHSWEPHNQPHSHSPPPFPPHYSKWGLEYQTKSFFFSLWDWGTKKPGSRTTGAWRKELDWVRPQARRWRWSWCWSWSWQRETHLHWHTLWGRADRRSQIRYDGTALHTQLYPSAANTNLAVISRLREVCEERADSSWSLNATVVS